MMGLYIDGWSTFFRQFSQQRKKKHGGGRRDFWTAVYCAAHGRYLVDHQHRGGSLPMSGRIARYMARNVKASR